MKTDYHHTETQGGIQVFNGPENAVQKGVEFMKDIKKKMDLCYESTAPSIVIEVEEYRKGYEDIRKRGGKIRIITEITKENFRYCKKLMEMSDEIRHLDNVKGGIAVSESAYMTTTVLEATKPLTQVVYSNVLEAVHQQQNFFNSLWERSSPASQKIKDITDKLDSKENNIFSALDNNTRRSILLSLREENMKISQLAKKLDISIQAFQKHYTKLVESNLIEKNQSGIISLTQIGIALTKQIPSIQFLFENNEFFKSHSLSYLPTKFIQQIGDLQEFELTKGLTINLSKFYEACEEPTKEIKLINPFFLADNDKESISKIFQEGARIQCLLDKDFAVPNEVMQITSKKKKNIENQIQRKIQKNSNIGLFISETVAGIMFPNLNGDIDFSSLLSSRNTEFINWCNDLFQYLWEDSENIIK